jgi:hypothetical protein
MQDPDSVEYEIEDMGMSGIVQLVMDAGKECTELQGRIDRLQVRSKQYKKGLTLPRFLIIKSG